MNNTYIIKTKARIQRLTLLRELDGQLRFKQIIIVMNKEQLDKIDSYFKRSSQQNLQPLGEGLLPENSNFSPEVVPARVDDPHALTSINAFKALQEDKHKKYKNQIKTKWDIFQPYAFHKLSDSQKDQHFLQLFDDYLSIKIKLNQEIERNKKLYSRNNFLELELSKEKSKSPQKHTEKNKRANQQLKENMQLKEQVKRLHEKIHALTGNKHKIGPHKQQRPQSAARTQKVIFPTNQNIKAELQMERKQVRELLIIIDELKATKFSLEAQLKQKQSKENVSRVNNRVPLDKNQNESQFQAYAFDLEKWKEKYHDLELCFNKMSEDKDRRIRTLQIQNLELKENERTKKTSNNFGKINEINLNHLQDKIADLQREKESFEKQIRRLVSLPFNQSSGNKSQIQLQQKNSKLELALQKLNAEFGKVKEERSKYLSELQFKTREGNVLKNDNEKLKRQVKQLLQKQTNVKEGTEIDYDDYYRKLLGIVKLQGHDPVWRKYSSLASPSFATMTEAQAKKMAQELWTSKLQLLAYLQKAQIQLRTVTESTEARIGLYLKDKQHMQEQLRAARARLDQWVSMDRVGANRQVQLFQQNGIRYDDSISVFQADEQEMKELNQQQNYFDLYLGLLNLDEASLLRNPHNKMKQIAKMVSFLTIDFYNHDTQHSNFVEGSSRKLANNFSFKVEMNQYTVKYLAKQSVILQLWSPQGASTVLLGKGQIWLRDLVVNAVKDISSVVRGKCPFYSQTDRSLVATLEYRFRMRLPIGAYCQWNAEQVKPVNAMEMFRLSQRKRLQVKILQASNLPSSSAHFVHFSLQGENYNTLPVRGSSPQWNYRKQIELIMDEQLQDQFKQKYLQFVVFDDDEQVSDDVVGIARASLTKMVDSAQQLSLDLDIRDDQQYQIRGKLKVEFRWI